MVHEVNWNKDIIDKFIEYGNLNNEQIELMKMRCSDCTDVEISEKLHFSIPTYYRRVQKLKKIYDKVQIEHPEMPKRELLNEKVFDFYCYENALDMLNRIDFDNFKIEVKIVKKD